MQKYLVSVPFHMLHWKFLRIAEVVDKINNGYRMRRYIFFLSNKNIWLQISFFFLSKIPVIFTLKGTYQFFSELKSKIFPRKNTNSPFKDYTHGVSDKVYFFVYFPRHANLQRI